MRRPRGRRRPRRSRNSGLPRAATASARSRTAPVRSRTPMGTRTAPFCVDSMAASREAISSGLFFGRRRAASTALKASVSRSMSSRKASFNVCPFSAIANISVRADSNPFLPIVRFATMAPSAAPREPHSAATLPPPGAGESVDSSSTKPRMVRSTRRVAPLTDAVLDDLLRGIEGGDARETERLHGDVDQLRLGHAGRLALTGEIVTTRHQDRLERDQADQFTAGDAEAELRTPPRRTPRTRRERASRHSRAG